ncbi:response regulator [Ectobacillus polymachus]|uniref:response regulator n=1 Tax=Ectobacillus polymachus TaxID=1508806 RepID=UPI003A85D72E
MNFFIVDDSAIIIEMLSNIIEEDGFGTTVGEAEDGSEVYPDILAKLEVDVLLIDLLMPNRDGIETIREIAPFFNGKIIMLSQVETKDMISEAYSLGVEYYITKPINRLEVVSILKKVSNHLLLEKSLHDIQNSLSFLSNHTQNNLPKIVYQNKVNPIISSGKSILLKLGVISNSGTKDLLDLLEVLNQLENEGIREMPPLRDLYEMVAEKRLGSTVSQNEIRKEIKSSEQRVRRTIYQALENIASLGLTDFANPTFENYSSELFDYSQIRMKMLELERKTNNNPSSIRINIKKFIKALFMEAKENE